MITFPFDWTHCLYYIFRIHICIDTYLWHTREPPASISKYQTDTLNLANILWKMYVLFVAKPEPNQLTKQKHRNFRMAVRNFSTWRVDYMCTREENFWFVEGEHKRYDVFSPYILSKEIALILTLALSLAHTNTTAHLLSLQS